jgi:hypothetical protein
MWGFAVFEALLLVLLLPSFAATVVFLRVRTRQHFRSPRVGAMNQLVRLLGPPVDVTSLIISFGVLVA